MLKELLSLFRSGEPLKEMGGNFTEMLGLSLELVKKAGEVFFRHSVIIPIVKVLSLHIDSLTNLLKIPVQTFTIKRRCITSMQIKN